jgi:hypothetical protein
MRVRRLPHETRCRPALAALQKADAVAGRLTSNAIIIETGTESCRPARPGQGQPGHLTPA